MLPTATVSLFPYDPDDAEQDSWIAFAVVAAEYQGKWVLCRHKKRTTWECPGGHREVGETPMETAGRELFEETGAADFSLKPVCVYCLGGLPEDQSSRAGLVVYAQVRAFGEKPDSEIGEYRLFDALPAPEEMTYPTVHPVLIHAAQTNTI